MPRQETHEPLTASDRWLLAVWNKKLKVKTSCSSARKMKMRKKNAARFMLSTVDNTVLKEMSLRTAS